MDHQAQMFKYINLARQFPSYFISIIDKQLQLFINERELPIDQEIIYETNEGQKAWKEAKAFLTKQTSLEPFLHHPGLNSAAKDHATDLAKSGIFGHTGSDKSTFSERILRYCKKGQGAMAEIIGADFYLEGRNNAEMTVLGLIIDDGVPDRGHRKTIFNPDYHFIGCHSQIQKDKLITVFNLTENKLQIRQDQSNGDYSQYYQQSNPPFFQTSTKPEYHLNNTAPNSQRTKSPKPDQKMGRKAFNEIENREVGEARQSLKGENNWKGKKMSQKKQVSKVYFEEGCKVTEKTTWIVFGDGTVEEKTEKHTVYV